MFFVTLTMSFFFFFSLPIGHPRAKQKEYRPFDFMSISEGHLQKHELMHDLYEIEGKFYFLV